MPIETILITDICSSISENEQKQKGINYEKENILIG